MTLATNDQWDEWDIARDQGTLVLTLLPATDGRERAIYCDCGAALARVDSLIISGCLNVRLACPACARLHVLACSDAEGDADA